MMQVNSSLQPFEMRRSDGQEADVSVIIPCFRCFSTIQRAVASVAAQTLRPSEVILVDDASADDTPALLQELARQYEPGWIKLILLARNVGAGSARNAGWAAASQTYVAFLDADDAWHERKVEIQHAFMQQHPDIQMSGHGFRISTEARTPCWELPPELVPPQVGHRSISKWRLLLSNQFVTPSVMIRRDVSQRFVETQRFMEDHMLWLAVVCSGGKTVKLSVDLAAIYKRPFGVNGLSASLWLMGLNDLGNYKRLYKRGYLSVFEMWLLAGFSVLKFVRRLVLYAFYLRWKRVR